LLVLLATAYFFFMAAKAAFVDMSSRISKIVEVQSDVLVDLLVMLAVMFNAVAPSSTLEGLPVVAVLVGERLGRRSDLGVANRGIEVVEYEGL